MAQFATVSCMAAGSRNTGTAGSGLESVNPGVAGMSTKSPAARVTGGCWWTASTHCPCSMVQKLGWPNAE